MKWHKAPPCASERSSDGLANRSCNPPASGHWQAEACPTIRREKYSGPYPVVSFVIGRFFRRLRTFPAFLAGSVAEVRIVEAFPWIIACCRPNQL